MNTNELRAANAALAQMEYARDVSRAIAEQHDGMVEHERGRVWFAVGKGWVEPIYLPKAVVVLMMEALYADAKKRLEDMGVKVV